MSKSPITTKFLDDFTKQMTGISRTESLNKQICVFCHCPITEFRDDLSIKEYSISGLCQKCQDTVFK